MAKKNGHKSRSFWSEMRPGGPYFRLGDQEKYIYFEKIIHAFLSKYLIVLAIINTLILKISMGYEINRK